MKLVKVFFILIVAVGAQPHKREEDKEADNIVIDAPFMALLHAKDSSFDFQQWAIILTDKWLLTSSNSSQWTKFNISVQTYADLLNSNSYEHEIETIIQRKPDDNGLIPYPPFELIKLKQPISLGDSQQSIQLAGPNYTWKANKLAKVYYLTSIFPDEVSSEFDYFHMHSIKVMPDEEMYKSQLSSCLKSQEPNRITELICDPAIFKGTLVGFSLRIDCENQLFMPISSIYDWISKYVPNLKEVAETNPINQTPVVYKRNAKYELQEIILKKLFGSYQMKIADQVYFSNVTIIINGIRSN